MLEDMNLNIEFFNLFTQMKNVFVEIEDHLDRIASSLEKIEKSDSFQYADYLKGDLDPETGNVVCDEKPVTKEEIELLTQINLQKLSVNNTKQPGCL